MKTIWARTAYFLIGVIFAPIFFGLAVFIFRLRPQEGSAILIYASSAFLCFCAIVTASAFRAVFRNPPWWIVSPEQSRKSTLLLLRGQLVSLSNKRLKLAEQSEKLTVETDSVAKRIEELEKAEPVNLSV